MRVNLQAQGVWDATQREGFKVQQDRMALAAIYQAIPEDVLLMLANNDTAKEAWETLRTMYMGAKRVKEAKVQTLRSDFKVIRMKDSESVDEFVMRLNTIVMGIRSLEPPLPLGAFEESLSSVLLDRDDHLAGVSGHLKKLDDRSKNMVYFGVEDGTKGNRLYDLQDKKMRPSPEDVQADSDPNIVALDPFSSPSSQSSNSPNAPVPRGFRSLNDIYARTQELTLEPEEPMMAETDQPSTFEEAVVNKVRQEAMQAELNAIEKNKMWQLTSLPPGHKVIGLKCVYKVKKDNMGNVVKYKACLVAKGYVQKQGVDYDEMPSQPSSIEISRRRLMSHNQKEDIIEFKEQMKNEFEMSDLELLAYYLGIEVSQKKWGIALRQTCYARKFLEQFGMQYYNPTKSPMERKLKVDNDDGGEEIDSTKYR
nr:hypothetical protein [Tanacetum cinerariifolium]